MTITDQTTIDNQELIRSLDALQKRAHRNSVNKGFWDDAPKDKDHLNSYIGNKLMLIVSEIAEAQDHIRNGKGFDEVFYNEDGKPDGFSIELADAGVRLLDLFEFIQRSMATDVLTKMDFNDTRAFKHGKKF